MWSRNSPFTLISIGGERHSKDPRFWVEEPDVNNTSKQSWVSFLSEARDIQGVTAISGKRFKLIFLVLIYVVLKQTIYQQKALDLSFNLAP